jgi:hypothetical protein
VKEWLEELEKLLFSVVQAIDEDRYVDDSTREAVRSAKETYQVRLENL